MGKDTTTTHTPLALLAALMLWPALAWCDCQDYADRYRREYLMVTHYFQRAAEEALEFRQHHVTQALATLRSHEAELSVELSRYEASGKTPEALRRLERAFTSMGIPITSPDLNREYSENLSVSGYSVKLKDLRGEDLNIRMDFCMTVRSPMIDGLPYGGTALDSLYYFGNSHILPQSRGIGRGHEQHCDSISLPRLAYTPFHSVFSSRRGRHDGEWRRTALPPPEHSSESYIYSRLKYGGEAPQACADQYGASVGYDPARGEIQGAAAGDTPCARQRRDQADIFHFNQALFLQVARDVSRARTEAVNAMLLRLRANRIRVATLLRTPSGLACNAELAGALATTAAIPLGSGTIEEHLTDTGLKSSGTRIELDHTGRGCSLRICQGYNYNGADAIFLRRRTYPWDRYVGTASVPNTGNSRCSLIDLRTLAVRYLWDEPSASGVGSRSPLLTEAQFLEGALSPQCREEHHTEVGETAAHGASAGENP